MKPNLIIFFLLISLLSGQVKAQKAFDLTLNTTQGDLLVKVLGHASLKFEWNGLSIYVDPYSQAYTFSDMTKADIILITHEHDDHYDSSAIGQLKKDSTLMIYTTTCEGLGIYTGLDTIMSNGDSIYIDDIGLKAVPAYNIVKSRHVKGVGNGYILTFGNKRVYVAGDTEVIPAMDSIKNIDLAFFGYSVFNMDNEMFLEALTIIKPGIVIPYHYDSSSISTLISEVSELEGIVLITESPQTSFTLLKSKDDIKIYPNPANDHLYGALFERNSTLFIYNSAGRLVAISHPQEEGILDVSNLTKGIYLFTVLSSEKSVAGRFTIER